MWEQFFGLLEPGDLRGFLIGAVLSGIALFLLLKFLSSRKATRGAVLSALKSIVKSQEKELGITDSTLTELKDAIQLIQRELRDNGGTSIKDAIKRIERQQKVSEQQDFLIFEMLGIPVFVTGPDGRNWYVSPAYCEKSGRTAQQLMGYSWKNIIHPSQHDAYIQRFQDSLDTGDPFIFERVQILLKNGYVECDVMARAVTDESGHAVWVAGFFRESANLEG